MINADYQTSPSYDIVESISRYEIEDYLFYPDFNTHIYLVQDRYTFKYNVYVTDFDISLATWHCSADFLHKCVMPITLDQAVICFPQYAFTDEIYGF